MSGYWSLLCGCTGKNKRKFQKKIIQRKKTLNIFFSSVHKKISEIYCRYIKIYIIFYQYDSCLELKVVVEWL